MAKAKRPVLQTYEVEDVKKGRDPYIGIPYSKIRPEGAPVPTHRAHKIPGVRRVTWEPQMERWVA